MKQSSVTDQAAHENFTIPLNKLPWFEMHHKKRLSVSFMPYFRPLVFGISVTLLA